MRHRAVLSLVIIALTLAVVPALRASDEEFEAKIGRVRAAVLAPHFSREDITQALVEALDAALLILPATEYAAEFKSRVGTARKMLSDGALFEDKVRQYLGLAYRMVAGGKFWEVPEELKSEYREVAVMERAKKICVKLIDSALAENKAGRHEPAVRDLVSFVIFVITPIEA